MAWPPMSSRPGAAPFFGLRLVERLNIAIIAGLPLGMAAFLLANRLLPAGMPGRADAEVAAMFWTWGAAALLQCARPPRLAWRDLFALGALAFAAIPIVDALATPRLAAGDPLFLAFDSAMAAMAVALAFASRRAARIPAAPVRRSARKVAHA